MTALNRNESNDERRARITLGVAIAAFGIALEGTWGFVGRSYLFPQSGKRDGVFIE